MRPPLDLRANILSRCGQIGGVVLLADGMLWMALCLHAPAHRRQRIHIVSRRHAIGNHARAAVSVCLRHHCLSSPMMSERPVMLTGCGMPSSCSIVGATSARMPSLRSFTFGHCGATK